MAPKKEDHPKLKRSQWKKIKWRKNNMKKLSPKQKKIARAAHPYDKITGADFAVLRKKKKKRK